MLPWWRTFWMCWVNWTFRRCAPPPRRNSPLAPRCSIPWTILVPALATLREWDVAAQRVWEHSAEFLLERSGRSPEAPRDWRQDVKLACTCADCRELQAFTLDPGAQTHRFR